MCLLTSLSFSRPSRAFSNPPSTTHRLFNNIFDHIDQMREQPPNEIGYSTFKQHTANITYHMCITNDDSSLHCYIPQLKHADNSKQISQQCSYYLKVHQAYLTVFNGWWSSNVRLIESRESSQWYYYQRVASSMGSLNTAYWNIPSIQTQIEDLE